MLRYRPVTLLVVTWMSDYTVRALELWSSIRQGPCLHGTSQLVGEARHTDLQNQPTGLQTEKRAMKRQQKKGG